MSLVPSAETLRRALSRAYAMTLPSEEFLAKATPVQKSLERLGFASVPASLGYWLASRKNRRRVDPMALGKEMVAAPTELRGMVQ